MQKKVVFIAIIALLVAGFVLTPVLAAAPPAATSADGCGDTYVIQPGDYLDKIARRCGTTVASILSLNPQIFNPNVIYTGNILRLTDNAPVTYVSPYPYNYYPYYSNAPYGNVNYGSNKVSLSTTWAREGDVVTVFVNGFPPNAEIDYRVGEYGEAYVIAYDGNIDAYGTASQTVAIPPGADAGEYWVVRVMTTSQADVVDVNSPLIYISGDYQSYTPYYPNQPYAGSGRVTLSKTSASDGDSITVYVSGFPANAEIDYRLGKRGESYSVVYDGKIAADGTASQNVTIPPGTNAGEHWVVWVMTTSQADIVEVSSPLIYITD